MQLTDPDNFYFPETAIGLRGHGLARFGSNCYLTPLNTKMDDSCCFEVKCSIIDGNYITRIGNGWCTCLYK